MRVLHRNILNRVGSFPNLPQGLHPLPSVEGEESERRRRLRMQYGAPELLQPRPTPVRVPRYLSQSCSGTVRSNSKPALGRLAAWICLALCTEASLQQAGACNGIEVTNPVFFVAPPQTQSCRPSLLSLEPHGGLEAARTKASNCRRHSRPRCGLFCHAFRCFQWPCRCVRIENKNTLHVSQGMSGPDSQLPQMPG